MFQKSRFLQLFKLKNDQIPNLHFTLIAVLIISIFFSRYVLTLALVALSVSTVVSLVINKKKGSPFHLNQVDRQWIIFPTIVMLWYFISCIYSANIIDAVNSIKVKILFFLLPFSLVILKNVNRKQISLLYHLFLALSIIGTLWSLIQIQTQQLNLSEIYARGEVIPTIIPSYSI